MNQVFLSAVFLQKIITHSPSDRIYRPESSISRRSQNFNDRGNNTNSAVKSMEEKNREFFKKLAKPRKKSAEKTLPKTNSTILIIAPHPDDEILATSQLISRELARGNKVKIIYITDGDAQEDGQKEAQTYGRIRKLESQAATKSLGLNKNDLFFLGFPDGYLDKLPKIGTIQSKFSGRNKTPRQSYFPNLNFSQEMLIRSIQRILDKENPSEIYFPSPDENHPDHAYLGELFINKFGQNPAKKFTYIVHNGLCKKEICNNNQPIDNKKLKLIKYFQSQRFTLHHIKFLEQFAKQKEVFKEITKTH
jgi:LmbE family N-acetylglucosaminyl deacetylase